MHKLNIPLMLDSISDLSSLKSFGSYLYVKTEIEDSLDIKLGVRGWSGLLKKILLLQEHVINYLPELSKILENKKGVNVFGGFNSTKKHLSDELKIPIKAKSWLQLKKKITLLINTFSRERSGIQLSNAQVYEITKKNNFIASSRLEGINISTSSKFDNLESILNKYREN